MGNCEKCWDNPCTCGHEYQSWSIEQLDKQIAMLKKVREGKITKKLQQDPPTQVGDLSHL